MEGSWNIEASQLVSDEQKKRLLEKLSSRLTKDNVLQIRSQVHRTQLANKEEVIARFNILIEKTLQRKKSRIATKPSKAAKEKRLEGKKQHSSKKENRKRVSW